MKPRKSKTTRREFVRTHLLGWLAGIGGLAAALYAIPLRFAGRPRAAPSPAPRPGWRGMRAIRPVPEEIGEGTHLAG